MLNKLFIDLSRCAQLSGHGSVINHREIDVILVNDKDGHQRQVVIDKGIDSAPEMVAAAINRVYNAFYSKSNAKFWDDRINAFEFEYQIDWYLMISYLYMADEDERDTKGRELRTVSNACAVLCNLDVEKITNTAQFKNYMKISEAQNHKEGTSEVFKDTINVMIS